MASKKRENEWQSFMGALQFQYSHETVLAYLHYEGSRPAVEAASRARSWAGHICLTRLAISEYKSAIDDMLNRDLLWVIDESKQLKIEQFVASPAAAGPIDVMPPIGSLQFSIRLARLMDEFWATSDSPRPTCIYSPLYLPDNSIEIYSNLAENCVQFVSEDCMIAPESANQTWAPLACGPWRDTWWRLYETGYVLHVPAECRIAE